MSGGVAVHRAAGRRPPCPVRREAIRPGWPGPEPVVARRSTGPAIYTAAARRL
ncbi:MAG: hypothetical protein AVDCRST_MAG73-983 [uncultured Thermomicrobiales bacterium]|uniref:Uncharacterized protein n=1 Tax=uncultured Thermomicrobiales bacterium TaxID=1645740 RepID=A0A6J4TUK6_9BACT|nr:MAG: hypothetical protein AVDCRST_MAG73-983 [uncultured Thermomicrobiales bacterium]